MSALISGVLVVVLFGRVDASGGVAAYGTVANEHIPTQKERRPVEEVVEPTSPCGCAADHKVEREKGPLDPQLWPSKKWINTDPADSVLCNETESTGPMNR